jgi:hypothetical protein
MVILGFDPGGKNQNKRSGWRDLCRKEKNAFSPVPAVEYWMPV